MQTKKVSLFTKDYQQQIILMQKIKNAVEKAYTQNETTMSKVVLDNGNTYFENMSETGCKVFVDQRNWQDIYMGRLL